MLQRHLILFVLVLSLGGRAICAQEPDKPADPAATPDKPQQPAAKPTETPAPPTPEASPSQEPPKTTAAKPHHVITNDDLQKGDMFGAASLEIDISNINDCDRNCFEMVRRGAPSLADPAGQWKRDLLHAIDKVSADAKWQAALGSMARAKSRFCQLAREKNDALANEANPRNVTEQELSIEEEYDRKFKAAQGQMNDAFADADAVIRGYSGIVVPFMGLQKMRVTNAACLQPQPSRYRPYQPRYVPPDDPDDP